MIKEMFTLLSFLLTTTDLLSLLRLIFAKKIKVTELLPLNIP